MTATTADLGLLLEEVEVRRVERLSPSFVRLELGSPALAELGGRLVVAALSGLAAGRLKPTPQPPGGISYARMLSPDDGRLDWSRSAAELTRVVRAFAPAPGAWFAYDYWLDDARAPDFARCVEIHRKPGYDPAELLFDPRLRAPKVAAAWKLAKRVLGFRSVFDVVGLDPAVVKGTHGRRVEDPRVGPVLITSDARLAVARDAAYPIAEFPSLVLSALRS